MSWLRAWERELELAKLALVGGLLLFICLLQTTSSGRLNLDYSSTDDVCHRFERWVYHVGGQLHSITCELDPTTNSRHIVATRAIAPETAVLQLPESAMFNPGNLQQRSRRLFDLLNDDPYLKIVDGQLWGEAGYPYRLALAIVYESAHKGGFWSSGYFEGAPPVVTSPEAWTDAQLDQFESVVITDTFRSYRRHQRDRWKKVQSHMQNTYPDEFRDTLTEARFAWACGLVETRVFPCAGSSVDPWNVTRCVFPAIFELNPTVVDDTAYGFKESSFQVLATAGYEPGARLYVTLGLSRARLTLQDFGFLMEGLEHQDAVGIVVQPQDCDYQFNSTCVHDLSLVGRLDGCIHVVDKEDASYVGLVADAISGSHKTTDEHEQLARAHILRALKGVLANATTSYLEDAERALSDPAVEGRTAAALRARYKRVIEAMVHGMERPPVQCAEWLDDLRLPTRGDWLYEIPLPLSEKVVLEMDGV
eukprot:m.85835 g.85835  ORF g.85835 m.85835 type:complete len:478 (-) comp11419_c1_seq1:20-1453(-)